MFFFLKVRKGMIPPSQGCYLRPPSSMVKRFLLILFFLAALTHSTLAATKTYKWEVSYMFWSPDCVESVVIGINGQFPGPPIRAKAGETVEVEVTNKLDTEGIVIHWHGITQFKTPWADGTASISQCAIKPGETFVYRFEVEKPGTYFYHGHYGMQRSAGLYGFLIVERPWGYNRSEPFHYDGEHTMLLSDWWHKGIHEQTVGLSSIPFRWVEEPESLLIEGKGQYNCSLAAQFSNGSSTTCKGNNKQCTPHILHVLPNKTYRLRIVSTTALSSLNVAIGNHKMEVVEADGNYVEPVMVDNLDIYSGESYSVLIRTDQDPNMNYWVSVSVRGREPKNPPALTILEYTPSKLPTSPPPVSPPWNDSAYSKAFAKKILARRGSHKPPNRYDRRIFLLNTQNTVGGYTRWSINNISLVLPTTPYLGSLAYGLNGTFDPAVPPDNFPSDYDVMKPPANPNSTLSSGIYTLEFNTTVDVILQNANVMTKNDSEIHPWHLHGHDFWVLGYGDGKFSAEKDEEKLNLENPPLKNTAVIFPYGWTALRFVANNPGVWAFHCHIEPHLHLGMGVIFAEGIDLVDKNKIPKDALACGMTASVMMNG